MKKLTKMLSLSLTLAMLIGLLAGCGGAGGAAGNSAGLEVDPATLAFPLAETATITGLTNFPAGTESEPNNRTIFKRLEEQTNVHVEWKTIQSDQWGEKIALEMSNIKTLPDFVFNAGFSDTDLLKYAKQGVIINLEEYIDKYMPNLSKVFELCPICPRCLSWLPSIGPCAPMKTAISGRFPGLSSWVMRRLPSRPWAI